MSMRTDRMTSTETSVATSAAMDRWRSFHIHYHASLDRLLLDFLPPLLRRSSTPPRSTAFSSYATSLGGLTSACGCVSPRHPTLAWSK